MRSGQPEGDRCEMNKKISPFDFISHLTPKGSLHDFIQMRREEEEEEQLARAASSSRY